MTKIYLITTYPWVSGEFTLEMEVASKSKSKLRTYLTSRGYVEKNGSWQNEKLARTAQIEEVELC